MKRGIFVVFVVLVSFLNAKNIIDIYRFKGIKSVQKALDKDLKSQKFWENYLKDYNTSCGYFEDEKYLIKSDKELKKMDVFHITNGKVKKLATYNIIVGKNGEKKREGDLVTPVGVYKILLHFKPLNTFYGPIAFVLSYPNLYDKLQGRDGHGIWIHGYPIDDESRPNRTKGCLVLKNDQLLDLNSTIKPYKTYVAISEKHFESAKRSNIAKILAFLYDWRDSWAKSDIDRYLSFYSKDFKRFDGKSFEAFAAMKRRIFAKKGDKSIVFEKISILPYPNISGKKLYRIDFYEKYSTKGYKFNGNKELYVENNGGKIEILAEK